MKKLLPILVIFFSIQCFAQDYKLFPDISERLFCIPFTVDTCYDLSFDSIIVDNNGITYYNYFEIGDEMVADSCEFWGGPTCLEQNKASWLGPKVFRDLNNNYHFYNNQGDTLHFSFNTILNDKVLFYEDVNQSFYIEYQGSSFTNTLSVFDSIRSYKISHYDSDGNVIESALNEQPINISKNFGLAHFFKIDLFPIQLQTLQLAGINEPDLGIQCITEGNMHQHEIGDEIQYKKLNIQDYGPPEYNYTKYTKYKFLDKWETNDSIHYLCERTIHYQDSIIQYNDTIIMEYSHFDTIAKIPFQKPDNDHSLLNKTLSMKDYNGLSLLTYNIAHKYLVYCEEDNCWGSYDTFGPPENEVKQYVVGLGLFKQSERKDIEPPQGYFYSNEIIYFKKSNITYGTEVVLDINEIFANNTLDVFPQPAHDRLIFKSPNHSSISHIDIYDISGKRIQVLNVGAKEFAWDCSNLKSGIYFYHSDIENKNYHGKIIISK